MMAGLFILLAVSIALAIFGKRTESLWVYYPTLLLCVLMLLHHATSHLNIQL